MLERNIYFLCYGSIDYRNLAIFGVKYVPPFLVYIINI